jgi:hypothetical protein
MSLLRFPWLFPIRNPCELRVLCSRSYFGPRTCGRSINHFSSKCSGFLIRVSPSHPYWGRCNAIVPLHLPDALEYKFLGCIPEHHWLWMARSEIRMAVQILPLQCRYRQVCVCVFITAGPVIKLFAGGGGGEWRTCAMRDDEPRPVWMSPLITHC